MKSKVNIVIGAGFGDEGKGKVVNYLCDKKHSILVIRFCGGHQAGHTVYHGGIKHTFSNFGSGTLKGIPTFWSKFCTIDPVGIINELNVLESKGINPKLYIDFRCPVTTPYDKSQNLTIDTYRNHGTCGVGFGATLQREEDFYSLRAIDIMYEDVLNTKLELIKSYYNNPRNDNDNIDIDFFKSCCNKIREMENSCARPISIQRTVPEFCDYYIFEGAQGLLLDQMIGFFPHVTRSNTGLKNALEFIKEMRIWESERNIYYVTRAYHTRHGNGPMHWAKDNLELKNIDDVGFKNIFESNSYSEHQGVFRSAPLNLDMLKYAIDMDELTSYGFGKETNNTNKTLIINHMDILSDMECWPYISDSVLMKSSREDVFLEKIAEETQLNIKATYSPYL